MTEQEAIEQAIRAGCGTGCRYPRCTNESIPCDIDSLERAAKSARDAALEEAAQWFECQARLPSRDRSAYEAHACSIRRLKSKPPSAPTPADDAPVFLGRCETCLDNAYLPNEPCATGYGNGQPVVESDCLIFRASTTEQEVMPNTKSADEPHRDRRDTTPPASVTEPPGPALFQRGKFTLHSGQTSSWKVECDALSDEDWVTLAHMARERLPAFSKVIGVPRGGLVFADVLRPFASGNSVDPVLICDDVLTTGGSMEAEKSKYADPVIGVVAFARNTPPSWITAIWSMRPEPPRPATASVAKTAVDPKQVRLLADDLLDPNAEADNQEVAAALRQCADEIETLRIQGAAMLRQCADEIAELRRERDEALAFAE